VIESRSPEDIPIFNRLVLNTPVGSLVNLRGLRGGKPTNWHLTTINREPNQAREVEMTSWGLTVRDFTRVSALENRRASKQGLLVDSVRSGGPCAECKPPLRTGDIITRVGEREVMDVHDLREFTREFVRDTVEPKPLLVTFERDWQTMATVAKIGPEIPDEKPARPAKAWLGVQTQVLTRELAEALDQQGRKGVRLTRILPGSPAEKAGFQVGDIFLKLDGQVIAASTPSDQELFDNLIRQYKVGAEAEIVGVRAGKPIQTTVQLGHQPKPSSELDEHKDEVFEFTAREMSFADRVDARLEEAEKGVRIGAVQGAGWASIAGLASGDILLSIDGKPVENIAAFKSVMTAIHEKKPRRTIFFVKRGIRTLFLEIEPKW
jgi:serine protease Do